MTICSALIFGSIGFIFGICAGLMIAVPGPSLKFPQIPPVPTKPSPNTGS